MYRVLALNPTYVQSTASHGDMSDASKYEKTCTLVIEAEDKQARSSCTAQTKFPSWKFEAFHERLDPNRLPVQYSTYCCA